MTTLDGVTMDYHALTKKCDGMCDSCECPPSRGELVTCGGGLPGDPNGEHAALAVEGLVRKYEGAMLRETLREALTTLDMVEPECSTEAELLTALIRRGEMLVLAALQRSKAN